MEEKYIELFFFRYRSQVTGKICRSRHRATREEILRQHPDAEVLEETRERRRVTDDWTKMTYRAG